MVCVGVNSAFLCRKLWFNSGMWERIGEGGEELMSRDKTTYYYREQEKDNSCEYI